MYCPNCGKANPDGALNCSSCGSSLNTAQQPISPKPVMESPQVSEQNPAQPASAAKSKLTAGLLGIFLGALGIHNFYLGFNKRGILQLVISLIGAFFFGVGPIVMEIWGIVEGIMYLTGSKNKDANGNMLT